MVFDVVEFNDPNFINNLRPEFSVNINNNKAARYNFRNTAGGGQGQGTFGQQQQGQQAFGSQQAGGQMGTMGNIVQIRDTAKVYANNLNTDILWLECWNDQSLKADTLLGLATVPLNRLVNTPFIDEWITLHNPSGASPASSSMGGSQTGLGTQGGYGQGNLGATQGGLGATQGGMQQQGGMPAQTAIGRVHVIIRCDTLLNQPAQQVGQTQAFGQQPFAAQQGMNQPAQMGQMGAKPGWVDPSLQQQAQGLQGAQGTGQSSIDPRRI